MCSTHMFSGVLGTQNMLENQVDKSHFGDSIFLLGGDGVRKQIRQKIYSISGAGKLHSESGNKMRTGSMG